MNKSIYDETKAAIMELCEESKLKKGDIVVVNYGRAEVAGIGIIDSEYIPPSNSEFINGRGRRIISFIIPFTAFDK